MYKEPPQHKHMPLTTSTPLFVPNPADTTMLERALSRRGAPTWAIPMDLLACNSVVVRNDAMTGERTLCDALQNKGPGFKFLGGEFREAIAFVGQDGIVFQARYTHNPRANKEGELLRYDGPSGVGKRHYLASVPQSYAEAVFARQGQSYDPTKNFWEQVLSNPRIPVMLVEGPAKALTMISLGYAAVAGYGAYSNYESKDADGKRLVSGKQHLARGLAQFAQAGRRIVLVPDMDLSHKTAEQVSGKFGRVAELFERRECRVVVTHWDPLSHGTVADSAKGVDDLLRLGGEMEVHRVVSEAIAHKIYVQRVRVMQPVVLKPSLIVNTRDLETVVSNAPKRGIIATNSGLGTGKTNMIGELVGAGEWLAITPLRSLSSDLSRRLHGVDRVKASYSSATNVYYHNGDIVKQLSMCADSLPNLSVEAQWGGEIGDLILDEWTHCLRHLVLGETCQKNRFAIYSRLREVIQKARRIIVTDADLTSVELQIVCDIRGESLDDVYFIDNQYRHEPWPVSMLVCKDHAIAGAELVSHINSLLEAEPDKLIHLATDSINVANTISLLLPDGLTVAVTSESTSNDLTIDPGETTAIRLIKAGRTAELLATGVRVVITSPSIVQGLSWSCDDFQAVLGLFTGGSISPRAMMQSLARVRRPIPRVVFANEFAINGSKWGASTDARLIESNILAVARYNEGYLAKKLGLNINTIETPESREMAAIAASLIAQDNAMRPAPNASLQALLWKAGHTITQVGASSLPDDYQCINEARKLMEATQLMEAELIGDDEAEVLSGKEGATFEEQTKLQLYFLAKFYGIMDTSDEAELHRAIVVDESKQFRGQVRNFEALFAPDGDVVVDGRMADRFGESLADSSKSRIALNLRRQVGVPAIVEMFTSQSAVSMFDPQVEAFCDNLRSDKVSSNVARVLGFNPKNMENNGHIIRRVLLQLGLKLKSESPKGQVASELSLKQDSYDDITWAVNRRIKARTERAFLRVEAEISDLIEAGILNTPEAIELHRATQVALIGTHEGFMLRMSRSLAAVMTEASEEVEYTFIAHEDGTIEDVIVTTVDCGEFEYVG